GVEGAVRVELLVSLGEALEARAPELSAQCHEAALQAALGGLESGTPRDAAETSQGRAVVSAVALTRFGQAAGVAAQLMGTGAQLLESDGVRLARWAELNLGIARELTSAGAAA